MKKKSEEELEEKCHCHDGEECTCGEECHCGDECDCGPVLPPLEEKLVLVGVKDDKDTKEAMKYLEKLKVDYKFLDLNEKDELFDKVDFTDVKVPTLLLVQTVVSGVAPGLDGIKDVFEG